MSTLEKIATSPPPRKYMKTPSKGNGNEILQHSRTNSLDAVEASNGTVVHLSQLDKVFFVFHFTKMIK